MFAHRKEVVLSSSLNAVFRALNDSLESEEEESYVACVAGGFYRPSKRSMERREGIGAGHKCDFNGPLPRDEKRPATQAKCNVVHNFNRGGYFTCTTEIPFKIACTRIIFLIRTLILLILALSLWVASCLNLSDRGICSSV